MPRFVLLYHDCPAHYARPSHWDLMFENGATLRTWALAQLPRDWQTAHANTSAVFALCPALADENTVDTEQLGDHRSAYLDFEGPLSGDRGQVIRVASGNYESEIEMPNRWRMTVTKDLSGTIELRQAKPGSTEWLLAYEPDR